jgi:hypothetical protein
MAACQLAELVLDERHQPIDGTVITASPGLEQRGGARGLILDDLILPLRARRLGTIGFSRSNGAV